MNPRSEVISLLLVAMGVKLKRLHSCGIRKQDICERGAGIDMWTHLNANGVHAMPEQSQDMLNNWDALDNDQAWD